MNTSLLLLALSATLAAEEAPQLKNALTFPSGDTLIGSPMGLDEEGHLLWASELFTNREEPFYISTIDSISIQRLDPPVALDSTQATITFQSHVDKSIDTLSGELLGFNEEFLTLRTWYGGDLKLRRTMLESVTVDNEPPAVIRGSGNTSDWTVLGNKNAWKIEKGFLVGKDRGSLARLLPEDLDQLKLSFDLDCTDYSPNLRLFFFANSGTDINLSTGYSVNIQRGSMQFTKRDKNRQMLLEGERFGARQDFVREISAHLDLYLDREKGTMNLYLDGNLICSATDPEPILEENWFHFSSPNQRNQSISNFTVRPWNGVLPKKKDRLSFREDLPGEGEQIELQNGDTIVGKVKSVTDGKLAIETEFMPVTIPISRLLSFQLTNFEDREEPRIYREDVRCYFPNQEFVTLKLSDITPTTISGYSQVFGEVSFQLAAFSRIDFNPYDTEARIRRGEPF